MWFCVLKASLYYGAVITVMAQLWGAMVTPGVWDGSGMLLTPVVYLEKGRRPEVTGGLGWRSECGPLTKVLVGTWGAVFASARCALCKAEVRPKAPCRRCKMPMETTKARFPHLKQALAAFQKPAAYKNVNANALLHAAGIDGKPVLIYTGPNTEPLAETYSAILM